MKFNRTTLIVFAVTTLVLMAFTPSPLSSSQETTPADPLTALLGTLTALGGFAALVPVLISFGKAFGLVKDGTSQNWSTGINLAALISLFMLQSIGKADLIPALNTQAGAISQLLTALLAFAGQVGISKLTYAGLRNSFLGFSFSSK